MTRAMKPQQRTYSRSFFSKGLKIRPPNIPPTRKMAIAVPVSAAVPIPRSVMMNEMFAPMTP